MDKRNKQKKFLVKALCVLLSFGLWLYITNVENPTRTYDLKNVPVELVNTDVLEKMNLALSPNQEFSVSLKLEGPANELYSVKAEDIKITADLGAYALKNGENNIPVQIVNYPQSVSIKTTSYLSVKVKVENLVEKEVKLYSNVKLGYKDSYSQSSFEVKPSVVNVSGPESLVNQVVGASLNGEVKNVAADFESTFPIKAVNAEGNIVEDVTLNKNEGSLAVKVGVGKTVAVKSKITGTVGSGLLFEGAEVSRTTVSVVGDPKVLETVTVLETEPINISGITANKDISTKLVIPEGIKVADGDERVTVKIKVKSEAPIEKTINANVNYINLDSKFTSTGATTIPITISGLEKDINEITASNIRIDVDLSKITAEGDHSVEWKAMIVNFDKSVIVVNKSGTTNIKVTSK